jgi:hypothetical protein
MLYDKRWENKVAVEPWRQTLLDAADQIETHGWIQHEDGDANSGFCVVGAIFRAFRYEPDSIDQEAIMQLRRYVARDNIVLWNDDPNRTKDEVITVLRQAGRARSA